MVWGFGTFHTILYNTTQSLTGGPLDESQNAHNEVYNQGGGYDNPNHQAKFSHELVAGGAAFEGFKLYEDHQRKEGEQERSTACYLCGLFQANNATGKTVDHAFAKELLMGFVGGEVDKLAETKGTYRLRPSVQTELLMLTPGMNAYDRERAHHQAKENASHMYNQHYERDLNADQYDTNRYGPPPQFQQGGGYGGNY